MATQRGVVHLTAFVTDDLDGLHDTKGLKRIDENILLRHRRSS